MKKKRKNIILMGATGSVGRQVLDVLKIYPQEFRLLGVAIFNNIAQLIKDLSKLTGYELPEVIAIGDESINAGDLKDFYSGKKQKLTILRGEKGLDELAVLPGADLLIAAIVGASGLSSVIKALENGIDVALANKEALVMAGVLVMGLSQNNGAKILPIDSEHSAVFHLIEAHGKEDLMRIILPASGGAFRDKEKGFLENVKIADALNHPTWNMGKKITIDSATLMNKGLEVIEAHYLFGLDYSMIDVLIHKESLVHAIVEYQSGLMYMEVSPPSMLFPISSALLWPDKIKQAPSRLDLEKIQSLHFDRVDTEKYPALAICYEAGRMGGNAPVVLNAANEVAVDLFLTERIGFLSIADLIEKTLNKFKVHKVSTIDEIKAIDKEARIKALEISNSSQGSGLRVKRTG